MRCTDRREMPTTFAIMRTVQCVALPGGSLWVSSTTRSIVAAGSGGRPGLRVLSRRSPARPSRANRSRHRRTHGREDDPCPPDVLLRAVAVGHDRPQSGAVGAAHLKTDPSGHAAPYRGGIAEGTL